MDSIIHPWNLVMLLMVTSVAAMVHSTDVTDVASVTGNHPEPRGNDANELQHTALSNFKNRDLNRHKRRYEGTFKVTIQISDISGSGSYCGIIVTVIYESGRTWGLPITFSKWGGFYAGSSYDYDVNATYYGVSDQVKEIHLTRNTVTLWDNDVRPEIIIINGPEVCDRYECNWFNKCGKSIGNGAVSYQDCYLKSNRHDTVPCELANANC